MRQCDDLSLLSEEQLLERYEALTRGSKDQLPFKIEADRNLCLDSPYHLATKVIDSYYEQFFEYKHHQLLDDVMAPWITGDTVRIDDINYDPKEWIGLLVMWPRGTFKSSCCRIICTWAFPYFKIRHGEDLTLMYTHQVQQKAVDHGEGIRATAKFNDKFRERFPEFAVDPVKEWDRKDSWRWPHFAPEMRQAGLSSFTAYGSSSSKIGGHYILRMVDDWEDEESTNSVEMINQSERTFRQFENLSVRGRAHKPWIAAGTYYHNDGPYRRLERRGGWLTWRVPAHEGSSKTLFDMIGLDQNNADDRAKVKRTIQVLETTRSEDLNFPKLYPWNELYKAALGQRGDDDGELHGGLREFMCQVQLSPSGGAQSRFDLVALENAWVSELPGPDEMWIYLRIDPARSNKKKGVSQSSIILGGVRWDNHRFVIRTSLEYEPRPTKTLRRAFQWGRFFKEKGYKVVNIGIEAVAFQATMATQARDGITTQDLDQLEDGATVKIEKSPCPIVRIERSEKDKIARILELDGPVSRGEVHFYTGDPMNRKAHSQLVNFPFEAMDAAEGVHDLYIKAPAPPRPLVVMQKRWATADETLEALGLRKRGNVGGTALSAELANWGR